MAITVVACVTGITTTIALPTGWSVGDCHLVLAHTLNGTPVTIPAGYTEVITAIGGTLCSGVLAYKILEAGEPSTTVWTGGGVPRNASLVISGLDPVAPFGTVVKSAEPLSTNSIPVPAITCSVTDGTSQIFGFWGHRNTKVSGVPLNMPSGYTWLGESLSYVNRIWAGMAGVGDIANSGGGVATGSSNQTYAIVVEGLAASTAPPAALDIQPTTIVTSTPALAAPTLFKISPLAPSSVAAGAGDLYAPALFTVRRLVLGPVTAGEGGLDTPVLAVVSGLGPDPIVAGAGFFALPAFVAALGLVPSLVVAGVGTIEVPTLLGAASVVPVSIETGVGGLDAPVPLASLGLVPTPVNTSGASVGTTSTLAQVIVSPQMVQSAGVVFDPVGVLPASDGVGAYDLVAGVVAFESSVVYATVTLSPTTAYTAPAVVGNLGLGVGATVTPTPPTTDLSAIDPVVLRATYGLTLLDVVSAEAVLDPARVTREGDAVVIVEPKYIVSGRWRNLPKVTGRWSVPVAIAAYRATPVALGKWSDAG